MLKTIDRIYLNLRNITKDPDITWQEGFDAGRQVQQAAIVAKLSEKSVQGFSDASLTLGYQHAVAVVKGEVE